MKVYSISKDDTFIIKGLAIFSVVLHNFFHWVAPSPGENEFSFSTHCIYSFFSLMIERPTECINLLFSYLGHYGVQVFIFISGFGLTLSLLKRNRTWGVFMFERIKKIYPLLVTGVIVFGFASIVVSKSLITALGWKELRYKLLFVHTLLPNSGLKEVGPWWFFGLIIQLYILFPLLFKLFRKYNWKAFCGVLVISYCWIFLSQYEFQNLEEVSLMQNAPGHLPEFCFGILFALNTEKKIPIPWFVFAVLLFVLGNFFHIFYPFTFLSVTVIFVFIFPYLKTIIEKVRLQRFFVFLGEISMVVFAVHAIFREPFVQCFSEYDSAWYNLISAILFFLCIMGISIASQKIYEYLIFLTAKIPTPKPNRWLEYGVQILILFFFLYVISYYVKVSKFPNEGKTIEAQSFLQSDTITIEDVYTNIANYVIDKNPQLLETSVSFDFKSSNDVTPALILSIGGVFWQRYYLTDGIKSDDGYTHYTFEYKYLRPFCETIKDKDLHIYFWNQKNVEGCFKDVVVNVNEK